MAARPASPAGKLCSSRRLRSRSALGEAAAVEGEEVEETEAQTRAGLQRLGRLAQQHADGAEGQHGARRVAHHQLAVQDEAVRQALGSVAEE